jgi:hypothetical protein
MQYYVRDERPESLARIEGPFGQEEAERYARQLNGFVAENSGLGWMLRMGPVQGPFRAVPETHLTPAQRREIARLARI